MSVWNPQVNTGFLFITSWKMTVLLSLLIPNMLRLSVEKNDKKAAQCIADLIKHNLVVGSCMPTVDIHQLRDAIDVYTISE